MQDSIDARYQIVQERTLPVIASEIHQIERTVFGVAMDGAIQIGQKLHEAKSMIPAGEWVKWLDENLNYSQRQAYNFMEIADNYGDPNSPYFNLQTSANLSISKALELLRLPEETVESFAENHDIENETTRSLREEISRLKAEKEAAERAAKMAENSNDDIRKELASMQRKLADAVTEEDYARMQSEYVEAQKDLENELREAKDASAEIQAKLDKTKEDLKKAKEKLKVSEAAKDEEIQKRLAEAGTELKEKIRADAQKEVENALKEKTDTIQSLEAQVSALEAEKEKLSNTRIMTFKVLTDQLQEVLSKIADIIEEQNDEDPDVGAKMTTGLKAIAERWIP